MTDKEKAHRYLTHKENHEKYQYEESEIKSNFKWEEGKQKQATTEEFLKIAESKELSMREKAILLGRDYIRNYTYYQAYIDKMQWEEIQKNEVRTIADEVCDIIKWRYKVGNNIIDILEDLIRRLTVGERLTEIDEQSPFNEPENHTRDYHADKEKARLRGQANQKQAEKKTVKSAKEQLTIDEPNNTRKNAP